jgi:hypothetical protein
MCWWWFCVRVKVTRIYCIVPLLSLVLSFAENEGRIPAPDFHCFWTDSWLWSFDQILASKTGFCVLFLFFSFFFFIIIIIASWHQRDSLLKRDSFILFLDFFPLLFGWILMLCLLFILNPFNHDFLDSLFLSPFSWTSLLDASPLSMPVHRLISIFLESKKWERTLLWLTPERKRSRDLVFSLSCLQHYKKRDGDCICVFALVCCVCLALCVVVKGVFQSRWRGRMCRFSSKRGKVVVSVQEKKRDIIVITNERNHRKRIMTVVSVITRKDRDMCVFRL